MAELLLDPNIRTWVFVPIIVVTFFIGIIRHYVSILLTSQKKVELKQVMDTQALLRSRMLRENGKYIPKNSFLMRKHYFNDKETGILKVAQDRPAPAANPMQDPNTLQDMLKGNLVNVLPMIAVGGWINWIFSGFVTTKVPFPLTWRFKDMLQRGINLPYLDPSWVSSASWYFLNVFGLRQIYSLVLGADNAADQTKFMEDQVNVSGAPPDPKQAFKAEWEALELCEHHYALRGIEDELLAQYPLGGARLHDKSQ
ncbi:ER membrane protein complex subunit 3-like [Paramacrobiotus metropolitanus]|uniref:ER membrane protein complex subunit 3-like n=1 Tax=Paramacrobiotus metropolitanus TaxID=2943436 RepID=UPI0024465304|nr:ER membrane protein complex subunit 3-like [Paramacrobiotus metropolitanus]